MPSSCSACGFRPRRRRAAAVRHGHGQVGGLGGFHTRDARKPVLQAGRLRLANEGRPEGPGSRLHEPGGEPQPRQQEPPPIWTNPITEDASSATARTPSFQRRRVTTKSTSCAAPARPCAASSSISPCRWARQAQRVQFEGGYQFRSLRFRARVGDEPLAVRFTPRSKWVVNADPRLDGGRCRARGEGHHRAVRGVDLPDAARRMGQVEGGPGTGARARCRR